MAYGTRAAFDAVREMTFTDITSAYQALGVPFAHHARLIRIVNTMNAEIYVSTDGVTNEIRLASGSFILLDFSSNKVRDDGLFLPVGTQWYVKQVTAPSSGSVWSEVVYAEGGV